MKLRIDNIQHHRNGISGAPFHVILFSDSDEGRMLGVVFSAEHHVAVFNLDKLSAGNIAFGVNSWRGDSYEPYLRRFIALHSASDSVAFSDASTILAHIAREHLDIPTLESRRSDRLDFYTVPVWSVESALTAAFNAGVEHANAQRNMPIDQ